MSRDQKLHSKPIIIQKLFVNYACRVLPAIDVGVMYYEPGWTPGVRYPIVVKRTPMDDGGQTTLLADTNYKGLPLVQLRFVS